MSIGRLKIIALASGFILLVVLIIALISKDKELGDNHKEDEYNIVEKELLRIEPIAGTLVEDIKIEYNITEKTLEAVFQDDNKLFKEEQIDYGSPLVSSVKFEYEDNIANVKIELKEYCTYSQEVKNNILYVHFDEIDKQDNRLIVIDPGHGGYDVGAQNGNIYEKDINLSVAKYISDILKENGYIPIMTRSNDVFVSVEERVDFSNNMKPKVFVSIHCNDNADSSAKGTEILYNTKDAGESNSSLWLSKILLESITSSVSTKKRNVISGNAIHIVRNSTVPVALVEMGFMSNEEDLQLLSTSQGQKRLAQGIADGIMDAMKNINEMENKNE